MKLLRWIILAGVTLTSGHCVANEEVDKLLEETWQFKLLQEPIFATRQGVNDYNNKLPNKTPEHMAARYAQRQQFIKRIDGLDFDALSDQDKVNIDLLRWKLEEKVREYELGKYRMPINTFSNFYTRTVRVLNDVKLTSEQDYQDIIARINAMPVFFEQQITNMHKGIEDGFILPKVTVESILPVTEAFIYERYQDNPLYGKIIDFPSHFSAEQKRFYQKEAQQALDQSFTLAFRKLHQFLSGPYKKHARESVGVYDIPDGKDYYEQQIKRYVTTNDFTAEQIHQVGLSEVARIRAEMNDLIQTLEFDGTFEDFVNFLRTDPRFYANTSEDLIKEASYIAKRIDLVMPGYFKRLPRQPYGVEPVPEEIAPNYTTAAYWNASIGADKGGIYVVNTYNLSQRPLYELTALTLHEAVPGHHHQIALSQELENVPPFRRTLYISAFGEGWGLYSEKLGVEMGMYRNEYEHFGRLSYEMWRACRLVIDTGIHAKGWSRQQGLDYLANNTSLSLANVRAEVDRYISWPAQALSYKMGELKIWELRRLAEKELGQQFDIRQFHDVILKNGAVPLVTLEKQVKDYLQ
jgi:uncharacterized protein (DUF885 family)